MRNQLKVWLGVVAAVCLGPALKAACSYDVVPNGRNHGYNAVTNTITVNAGVGCGWSVTNNNSWITILSGASGFGTGVVTYAVSQNLFPTARTGLVFIADQVFTLSQDPAPCNFSVTPATRTHGNGGTALSTFAVGAYSNCSWSVVNTSAWVTLSGVTSGTGSNGSIPYAVAPNNIPVQRSNVMSIGDKTFTIIQNAASCIYEMSPTNRLHGHGAATNTVTVSVIGANCAWEIVNPNPWITILNNGSGTNSGVITYTVAPNPTAIPRTGTISLWGQTSFTVFQQGAPCTFSISPTSATPTGDPETNVFSVFTLTGCSWNVTNTNSWVNIIGPTNGVGDGTVTWSVAANASSTGRTGTVSIADKVFTIRQAGSSCNYRLSPTNRPHGYGAASNSVALTVSSTCPWTVDNTNAWITIHTPLSGVGATVVGYSVAANGNINSRMGTVLIGGQPFTVVQAGIGCAIDLTPATRNHGHGAATNNITVEIAGGCEWSVLNTNSWISIVEATNGVGSNLVMYTVEPNPTSFARSGYVVINEGAVLISQNAAPCTFELTPSGFTHSAAQETGTVSIASVIGCPWTIENTNSWITLLSPTNGIGSTNVSYFISTNLNPSARSGNLLIAGQVFSVIQNGVICSYRLSPTNRNHGPGANSNNLSITVSNPCPWTVVNTNPWITIVSGASGVGTGTIVYAFTANTSASPRTGAITVDGAVTLITQSGQACGYSLTPSQRSHGYSPATNNVSLTAAGGCAWTVVNTNSWITFVGPVSGNGSASFEYVVSSNGDVAPRWGNVLIGDSIFTVTQAAYVCTYRLSPTNRNHGFGATTGAVNVIAGAGCSWAVSTTNDWITFTSPTNGIGNSNFTYSITANFGNNTRVGHITLFDQVLTISQAAPTNGFQFELVTLQGGGGLTVRLGGGPAGIWELQSSSNLVDWVRVTDLTNITGRIEYTIPPPQTERRFFRAILP